MSFKSDVLKLASGTALAQVITLAVAPVLSRLFAPEAFGTAALFASLVGMLGGFVCLCYEQAIVISKEGRDAVILLLLCLIIALLCSLTIAAALALSWPLISAWSRIDQLSDVLWLLPIMIFLQGAFTALNLWRTRVREFGRLSMSQITGQATASSINVGGGLAGHTSGATMIYASIAGQIVTVAMLITGKWRSHFGTVGRIRVRDFVEQLKRHRNFPLYTSWSALVNAASWQLPVVLLGALFSPVVVGFYALGFRVLQMPMSLVGKSITQVLLQRAAVAHAEGDLASLIRSTFQRVLGAGLLPCLIVMLIGPELFVFAFGPNWNEAGVYVQLLAPWALIWFVSAPLSSIFYVLGRQREDMLIQALIFAARLVGILVGGYLEEPRIAVLLFSCAGVLTYGYMLKLLFGFVRLDSGHVLKGCASQLRDAVALAAPVLALKLLGPHVGVLIGASAAVVGAFVIRHRKLILDR